MQGRLMTVKDSLSLVMTVFIYGFQHRPLLPSHVYKTSKGWTKLFYDWRDALLAVEVKIGQDF